MISNNYKEVCVMKELTFFEAKISIPTSMENHNRFRNDFSQKGLTAYKRFLLEYNLKCKNLDDVIIETPGIAYRLIDNAVDFAIGTLNVNQVYTISKKVFIERYFDSVKIWETQYEEIKEEYNCLMLDKEQQAQYRSERKANRGRVESIGFGASGMIKGAATAGAMNLTVGAAHTIANIVGNVGTDISCSLIKDKIFESGIEVYLAEAVYGTIFQMYYSVMNLLNKFSEVKCHLYSEEDIEQAEAIIENIRNGGIPEIEIPKYLMQVMILFPYACNSDMYQWLVQKYKDPKGEIEAISIFFNFDISAYKIKLCDEIFKDLNISQNSSEEEIQEAKELIDEVCKEYSVDNSKYVNILNDFWNTLDINLRTVEGIVYESRIEAVKVKNDIDKIINVCKGKNLEDMEIVISIKNQLDEYLFQSKAINESYIYRLAIHVKKYIEHQEYLRRISKIHDLSKNIFLVFEQRRYYKKLTKRMYFRCFTEKFREKFLNVKAVTGVNTNEHIAFYYDSSITGNGNSGILVTKENLYLYESIFNKSFCNDCIPMSEINDVRVEKGGNLKVNTSTKEYTQNITVLKDEDIEEATSDFRELVLICNTANIKDGETDTEPVENEQLYQELLMEKGEKKDLIEQIDIVTGKLSILNGLGKIFKK